MGFFHSFLKRKPVIEQKEEVQEEKRYFVGDGKPDFAQVDQIEIVQDLFERNIIGVVYRTPLELDGKEIDENKLYVPPFVKLMKKRYDTAVIEMIHNEEADKYECSEEYKDNSLIPVNICIRALKEDTVVMEEQIHIWG